MDILVAKLWNDERAYLGSQMCKCSQIHLLAIGVSPFPRVEQPEYQVANVPESNLRASRINVEL